MRSKRSVQTLEAPSPVLAVAFAAAGDQVWGQAVQAPAAGRNAGSCPTTTALAAVVVAGQ
jgi:hypothetical protein